MDLEREGKESENPMWDDLEGGGRRKPLGPNGQVPFKRAVTRQRPKVVGRPQEGRVRKTEKPEPLQSVKASCPLPSLSSQFCAPV